jgi:hypothetical protein
MSHMKRLTTAVGATLLATSGVLVATAGTANAAAGSWRPYSGNPIGSTWHCATSMSPNPGVYGQACLIRATNGVSVQAAVIAHNTNSANAGVVAEADLMIPGTSPYQFVYSAQCRGSQMAAASYAVCFGPTVSNSSFLVAGGFLNDYQVNTTNPA